MVAMAFARRCTFTKQVRGGAFGPAESEGGERHEQTNFAWVGEARVLEIEAAPLIA